MMYELYFKTNLKSIRPLEISMCNTCRRAHDPKIAITNLILLRISNKTNIQKSSKTWFSGFFGFSAGHLPRPRVPQWEFLDATSWGHTWDMIKKYTIPKTYIFSIKNIFLETKIFFGRSRKNSFPDFFENQKFSLKNQY